MQLLERKLEVGDRVAASWDSSAVGTVKQIRGANVLVNWEVRDPGNSVEMELLNTSLVKLPPDTQQLSFAVGDRVSFPLWCDGESRRKTGTITEIPHNIPDVALLQMDEPGAGLGEVQLPTCFLSPETPEPASVEEQIAAIRAQGPVAPAGVWIETSLTTSKFRQAFWKAHEPRFTPRRGAAPGVLVKKSYIGKANGPKHKAALAQVERRNAIARLEKMRG